MQNGTATLEDSLAVSYRAKHSLTTWASKHIPWYLCQGIYELKTYVRTKTCTQILIGILLIITETWKQPRYPSIGKWINKLWYIHAMEYYSVLKDKRSSQAIKPQKRNRGTLNVCVCVYIYVHERSQHENTAYCMLPTIGHSRKDKTIETFKRTDVASGLRVMNR